MDKVLLTTIVILTMCSNSGVLTAPNSRGLIDSVHDDSVEQELVRHHHSMARGNTASIADDALASTDVRSNANSDSSSTASVNRGSKYSKDDMKIIEESLYDITVGDVIYDVLLTLRDHPEIVKELMESEQSDVEAANEAKSSPTANRAALNSRFSSASKNVEKKAVRSELPIEQDAAKRQAELSNDAFTSHERDAGNLKRFPEKPKEGGTKVEKFDYRQFISDSEDESESTDDTESEETQSRDSDHESTESEDSSDKTSGMAYGVFRDHFLMPFRHRYPNANPLAAEYKLRGDSSDSSDHSSKWKHHKNKHDSKSDTESDTSESMDEDKLYKLMYDKGDRSEAVRN